MKRELLLLLCLLGIAFALRGADEISECTEMSKKSVRVDARTTVGGRIIHGTERISPVAENENANARLTVDGSSAQGWTVEDPEYDSTQLRKDGWHEFALNEGVKTAMANLLVLNDDEIEIHGGVLADDEIWEEGKIHVIRNWVRIPQGKTLTVEANAIVKFCENTGIQVDGAIEANQVVFTSIADDTAGGDTDMNGETADIGYGLYDITGSGTKTLTNCDIRCAASLPVNTTWTAGDVIHVMGVLRVPSGVTLTIQSGAIVKFATGAELKAEGNNNISANGAIFTHIADDTAGGDTNGDGDASLPVHDAYKLTNFTPSADCDIRYKTIDFPKTIDGTPDNPTVVMGNRVYKVTENVTIGSNRKLVIQPGAILKMDDGLTITVQSGGTLEAIGNRAQPIVFTSIKDDAHGGDTDGEENMAQSGDWRQIYISGGTVNLSYAQIYYCGVGSSMNDAIYMGSGSCSLDNCIIAHVKQYVAGLDGGAWTMRNSVFYDFDTAFRHFGSNSNVNCVFYDFKYLTNNGSMNFANCVISNFNTGLCWWSDTSNYKNCVIWNPPNIGPQSSEKAGSNGNIWADPLFTDPANGDFSLKAGSPCIDAGDGTVAPETDYWGRPRMDVVKVADSGTPNADGVCPDIGIYEMSGSYTGVCANLTVSSITAPATARSGQEVSVSWTITNEGSSEAVGPWRDLVALQGDDELGGQIVPLGEATVNGTITPLASLEVTRSFTLPPMKPGNWKIGVTTNAYRDVYEVKRADNQTFAEDAMAVTLPVWSSTNNKFTVGGYGEAGFALTKSNSARIVTITLPSGAKMSAYGADGYLPSSGNSDVKSVTLANGTTKLFVPAGSEDAYVTLANEGGTSATATVAVAIATLSLLEASPTTILNRGTSTMRIIGTGLSANSVFKLTLGSTTVTGQTLSLEDGLVAVVQFNVNNIAVGSYTLSVTESGSTKSLSGKITVKSDGVGPKLEAWLETPPSVRDGRIYTAWLCYKNSGDADMTMPLFEVSCSSSTKIAYTVDGEYASRPLRYAGISPTAPAGVLKAGEENRVPVFFTLRGNYKVDFKTIAQNDTTHSMFGTWAEYAQAMAQAATRLNARGREEYRGTMIFDHALKEKNDQPCSAISGHLKNVLTGEPVAGYNVYAISDGRNSEECMTDEQGYFQLDGLYDGLEYELMSEEGTMEAQACMVNGDVNDVVLLVKPFGQLQGWITSFDSGQPLEGAVVAASSSTCRYETTTDAEGYYVMDRLQDGEYNVVVASVNGYCGSYAVGQAVANGRTAQVDFSLVAGHAVQGSLHDASGVGVAGVQLQFILQENGGSYSAVTDENGAWRVPGLPEGTFTVRLPDGEYIFSGEAPVLEVPTTADAGVWTIMPVPAFYVLGANGPTPLTATFGISEREYPARPETIEWDLDGDGVIDSREPLPSFIYRNQGKYNVSVSFEDESGKRVNSTWRQCVNAYAPVETRVNSSVVILDGTTGYRVNSFDESNLVLTRLNGGAPSVGVGTVLVCGEPGFAVRVTEVIASGNQLNLKYANAAFDEIFDEADIVSVWNDAEEATRGTRATGELVDLSKEISFKIGCVDYTLTSSMQVQTEFSLRKLNGKWKLSAALALPMKLLFNAKVGPDMTVGDTSSVLLFEFNRPFIVMAGPVPIVFNLCIPVYLDLSCVANFKATVSTDGELSLTPRLGFEFYDGNLSPISSWSPVASWEANKVEFDAKASIRGGVTVGAQLDIYAINHVGIFFSPYVEFVLQGLPSPEFRIDTGVDGKLEAALLELTMGVKRHNGEREDFTVPLKWSMPFLSWKTTVRRWRLPKTNFTYSPSSNIKKGDPVRFEDISAEAADAIYPTEWFWDFGDGTSSHEQFPVHTFQKEGKYSVSLKIKCGKIAFKKACTKVVAVGDSDDEYPPPELPPGGGGGGGAVQSNDPNEISGVIGLGDAGTQRFVKPGEWLDYTVYFENKSTAAAPAQEVWVMHNLSKWLDWSTLELGEIAFNNQIQLELKGKARGTATVPQEGTNYHVQMNAAMDEATGEFTLYLRSYDKTRQAYGYWPESVYAGFLPPNDESHRGEGHFTFRVKVKDNAPKDAFINAEATIVFDANAPITTSPAWFNWVTTDENPTADAMTLRWDTSDDANGTTYVVNYWSGDPDPTAEGASEPTTSDTLTTGSWRRPELDPGTYYWNVTKTNGNQSSTTSTWSFDIMATHTLTVHGGIGSGSYGTNTQVTAEANTVAGKTFTGWTAVGLDLSEAELLESHLVFYMPDHDVELTANYGDDVPVGADTQTLELAAGWNWVGFNVLPTSHKVGDVLGTAGFTANDSVQTNGDMCLFTGSGWFPGSFAIEFGRLYQIYSSRALTVDIHGNACESVSVPLVTGWNWIGNPTAMVVSPSQLTHSGGWTAGDRIQSPAGNVMYMGDKWLPANGLILEPGKGCQIYTANAGTLTFPLEGGGEDDDALYVVVDLSSGPDATSYPVRYTNTSPDLNDDTCRTTELWLRKIPAGTFIMGSPEDEVGRYSNETQHEVTLTQDYYIGVFECTQKQWELVMGSNPAKYKGDIRPIDNVSYDMIRGTASVAGAGWPEYGHFVDAASFMGKLQAKTGLVFDLPTEAQWEYSCRAGTSTALNSGKNLVNRQEDAAMDEVGRYYYDQDDGKDAGYATDYVHAHAPVGRYLPNSWGLYDMHGNVWEWCLDWYGSAYYRNSPEIDPLGTQAADGLPRVLRGGGNGTMRAGDCRSATRSNNIPSSNGNGSFGFRVAIHSQQDLYAVVDLSGGPDAASYPVRYSATGPDLNDDTCRTTELWLRRIPAGTFIMGSPEDEVGRYTDETQHEVTLTQMFYIGVFECTQRQWELVMGSNPSYYKGDCRPVERVSYNTIRGTGSQAGAGWPTYGHAVDSSSFMGKLQEKTGLTFDLPTEAQWEYACRAGTTTALNSGKNLTSTSSDAAMNEVGRYNYNQSDGKGGYSAHTKVGSYLPNAWGLYDMHGNVYEWCLDWYNGSSYGTAAVSDPVGPNTGSYRVERGGSWGSGAQGCRSAGRLDYYPSGNGYHLGFRVLCLPLGR